MKYDITFSVKIVSLHHSVSLGQIFLSLAWACWGGECHLSGWQSSLKVEKAAAKSPLFLMHKIFF